MRRTLQQAFLIAVALGLVGYVISSMIGGTSADRAKHYLARAQLKALGDSVSAFAASTGRFPHALGELVEVDPDRDGRARMVVEHDLRDPWGRVFEFRRVDHGSAVELASLGKDSRPGGSGFDADIVINVRLPGTEIH